MILRDHTGREVETEEVTKVAIVNAAMREAEAPELITRTLPRALKEKLAVKAGDWIVPTLLGIWFAKDSDN